MAKSGEGATSYEGGGAGGKFRKRPFRRPQTTPYDRPPTSIRNPNAKGWLSKLVDPASKLIMTSAQMFFSSVFRKRLPPPPPQVPNPHTEANQEPRDRLQEAVPNNYTGACNTSVDQVGNSSKSSDGNPISDLEQLLKQKTFTRSESDSLMALLRSRTVELPAGVEYITDKYLSQPPSDLENKEMDRSQGIVSSPIVSSRGVQENVASSPAELAKAYMGSRPTKVSSSMLGSNNQALREDSTLTHNQALTLTSKSPTMLQASISSGRIGVRDNGFISPRYRGRSAIYSMARSPYFGVHPTAQKGSGYMNDGFGGPPSSSRRVWENGGQSHSKHMALKRISSALDNEVGSDGAIRRVRQKPNLSSQGNCGNGVGSSQHHISSSPQKVLLSNEAKHKASKAVEQNGDTIRFPSKSSEMGTKILQHLEKLTPKEKSSVSKLVGGSEKSPTKLTSNMLSGQALRSLEHVDSSRFMRNSQDSHNSEDLKKDSVEENGRKLLAAPVDTLTSSINADSTASIEDTVLLDVKSADNNDSTLAAQPPQKGRAFQMSAHEDSVELDEDIHSDEPQFALPVEEREKEEKSLVEIKAVPTTALEGDKSLALPEVKIPAGSVSNERTDFDTGGGAVVSVGKSGFTFSTPASVTSTTFETTDHIESISAVDKSVPAKDPNDSLPVFSFKSKNVNKVPSFTFSPSPTANESSGTKPGSPSAPKPESLNSLENVASCTTDAQPKITASDKDDNNNSTQNGGDTKGNLETVTSAVSTSPSTSQIFSFSASNKNSNPNNGSLSSTPYVFSSTFPVLPSSSSSDQTFTNTFTQAVSSASTPTITSTTTAAAANATTTSAVPSIPAPPLFNFGSSITPSTAPLTASTSSIAETADSKAKTENNPTSGNENSSPYGGTSFATTTSGSTLFGFGSSVANPMANNQSQAPFFGTGSGSLISTQPSSSSGITPFTSGNSLFGSSSSAANFFGSSSSFGLSSSTSSSETASVSSTSSFSSITLGSSWQQPNKSPLYPSPFTSPNLSTGFSFGAPPTSTAATNTSPMVFGSSTGASSGPVFSFGSAAAAAATSTTSSLSSQSQLQPVFGLTPDFNAGSTNNDQMSMEDSMAEDHPVQASTPGFGQQPAFSSPAGFMLGSTAPSPANPFQFGGQAAPQNPSPSPFQASGSLEFNAGGSFSLGSGGGDKASRRTVRVSKIRNRMKDKK